MAIKYYTPGGTGDGTSEGNAANSESPISIVSNDTYLFEDGTVSVINDDNAGIFQFGNATGVTFDSWSGTDANKPRFESFRDITGTPSDWSDVGTGNGFQLWSRPLTFPNNRERIFFSPNSDGTRTPQGWCQGDVSISDNPSEPSNPVYFDPDNGIRVGIYRTPDRIVIASTTNPANGIDGTATKIETLWDTKLFNFGGAFDQFIWKNLDWHGRQICTHFRSANLTQFELHNVHYSYAAFNQGGLFIGGGDGSDGITGSVNGVVLDNVWFDRNLAPHEDDMGVPGTADGLRLAGNVGAVGGALGSSLHIRNNCQFSGWGHTGVQCMHASVGSNAVALSNMLMEDFVVDGTDNSLLGRPWVMAGTNSDNNVVRRGIVKYSRGDARMGCDLNVDGCKVHDILFDTPMDHASRDGRFGTVTAERGGCIGFHMDSGSQLGVDWHSITIANSAGPITSASIGTLDTTNPAFPVTLTNFVLKDCAKTPPNAVTQGRIIQFSQIGAGSDAYFNGLVFSNWAVENTGTNLSTMVIPTVSNTAQTVTIAQAVANRSNMSEMVETEDTVISGSRYIPVISGISYDKGGTSISDVLDVYSNPRYVGAAHDIGAVEHQSGGTMIHTIEYSIAVKRDDEIGLSFFVGTDASTPTRTAIEITSSTLDGESVIQYDVDWGGNDPTDQEKVFFSYNSSSGSYSNMAGLPMDSIAAVQIVSCVSFTINPVHFPGQTTVTNYARNGMSSLVNGPLGSFVMRFKISSSGIGNNNNLFANSGGRFRVMSPAAGLASGKIEIQGTNDGQILQMVMRSNDTLVADTWYTLLASWDQRTATNAHHLYVNGVSNITVSTNILDADIQYVPTSSSWFAQGSSTGGAEAFDGCTEGFGFSADIFVDWSIKSNRDLVMNDTTFKLTDPGADASVWFGGIPHVAYIEFSAGEPVTLGKGGTWILERGTGGVDCP